MCSTDFQILLLLFVKFDFNFLCDYCLCFKMQNVLTYNINKYKIKCLQTHKLEENIRNLIKLVTL